MRWDSHDRTGNKKRGSRCFNSDSLLGGGYLRLPMSLTVAVVTLRALCQEREKAGTSSHFDWQQKNERRHHC